MTRLYAVTSSAETIAAQFEVAEPADVDIPREIVECVTAPIIVEREGCRLLRTPVTDKRCSPTAHAPF